MKIWGTLTHKSKAQKQWNPRGNMLRLILIKLTKIKHEEKILKAAREKQQIVYSGIPIRLSVDFSAETLQARGSGRIYLKWWKGKPITKNILPSKVLIQIQQRNKYLYRQEKANRIQYHQTSFTTNVNRTSLGRKQNKKKNYKNKWKQWRKKATGTYISIIVLNVNGLKAATKR